ncbi:MAG: nuclear transport factor 2 family protein [Pseudomonadota bacterium]
MLKDLPPPIAAYVAANARLDGAGMLAPFAADAVVVDERRTRRGRDEIEAWIETATLAARAVFTPDAWRAEGETVVVEGVTEGDFPGSPLRFTFRFTLADGAISALEIGG